MVGILSQKGMGKKIASLRKSKGLSQEELARHLDIPRSSLAQIELGNRGVSVIELMKLSRVLTFSMDQFLMGDMKEVEVKQEEEVVKSEVQDLRIAIPKFKKDKFRNILLYILEQCGGKPNVGETVLYKLLYFSDFNYYELYEEHLTGAVYKKLPYGPVPQKLQSIIMEMTEQGKLKRIKTDYHGFAQTRYIAMEKADLKKMSAAEKEVIDRVIDQYSDWSASAISEYSHKDLPWRATEEGGVIDYELAFYRDRPFSVRNYNNEAEGDDL